jgi:hypothetical protein
MIRFNGHMAFVTVVSVVVAFFLADRFIYLAGCNYADGVVTDRQMNVTSSHNKHLSPIITFVANNKTVDFYIDEDLDYNPGDRIPIIYRRSNPRDARVFGLFGFWLQDYIYFALPILLFGTIIYSVLDTGEYAIVDFRKMTIRKISKEPEHSKTDKLKR